MINERLQIALNNEEKVEPTEVKTSNETEILNEEVVAQEDKKGIETTEEELSGFRIVQSILAEHIDVSRIVQRDTKSYFGILLDNNNRKPICRLWFNRATKYIEVFDENRKGEKIVIEELGDIYNVKDKIIQSAQNYEQ